MVWYGMVWYGMVWYGMVWYGMVWYGMVWYGMVWYHTIPYHIIPYHTIPLRPYASRRLGTSASKPKPRPHHTLSTTARRDPPHRLMRSRPGPTPSATRQHYGTHAARFHTSKDPGSRDSGTSLCPEETHPSKLRVGSGPSPGLPDSRFANWAQASA